MHFATRQMHSYVSVFASTKRMYGLPFESSWMSLSQTPRSGTSERNTISLVGSVIGSRQTLPLLFFHVVPPSSEYA